MRSNSPNKKEGIPIEHQEKEISAYNKEYQDTLIQMKKDVPPYLEATLLMETVEKHFSYENISQRRPEVVILGSSIPEELVCAFGVCPYWVLGGSLQTGTWAEDAAPRDADPVSRSILGHLLGTENLTRSTLILLPIVSDSTRKLAYLLRRAGMKVHTVDIPPVKDEFAAEKYTEQLELCAEVLSVHTGKHLTRRALRGSIEMVAQAHGEARRFLRLCKEKPGIFTAPWRMLILFSYYCTRSIPRWTEVLTKLNDRMEADRAYRRPTDSGSVLLIGSPIYFPNYKIPFLLQDAGLYISTHMDYTTQKIYSLSAEAEPFTIPALAERFYQADCSGAYAQNSTLQKSVAAILSHGGIDGVVCCVLKGQIEYDFELERIEEQCSEWHIPVFRLETDYSQQDVEQLRIRMEAFSEMLRQRQLQRRKAV